MLIRQKDETVENQIEQLQKTLENRIETFHDFEWALIIFFELQQNHPKQFSPNKIFKISKLIENHPLFVDDNFDMKNILNSFEYDDERSIVFLDFQGLENLINPSYQLIRFLFNNKNFLEVFSGLSNDEKVRLQLLNRSNVDLLRFFNTFDETDKVEFVFMPVLDRVFFPHHLEALIIEFFRFRGKRFGRSKFSIIADKIKLLLTTKVEFEELEIKHVLSFDGPIELDLKNVQQIKYPSDQLIEFLSQLPYFQTAFKDFSPKQKLLWSREKDIYQYYDPDITKDNKNRALRRAQKDTDHYLRSQTAEMFKSELPAEIIDKITRMVVEPEFMYRRSDQRYDEFQRIYNPTNEEYIKLYSNLVASDAQQLEVNQNFNASLFVRYSSLLFPNNLIIKLLDLDMLNAEDQRIFLQRKFLRRVNRLSKCSFLINFLNHENYKTLPNNDNIDILVQLNCFGSFMLKWSENQRMKFIQQISDSTKISIANLHFIVASDSFHTLSAQGQVRVFKQLLLLDNLDLRKFNFEMMSNNNLLCLFLCYNFPDNFYTYYQKFTLNGHANVDIVLFFNAQNINLFKNTIPSELFENIIRRKPDLIQFLQHIDLDWEPVLNSYLDICNVKWVPTIIQKLQTNRTLEMSTYTRAILRSPADQLVQLFSILDGDIRKIKNIYDQIVEKIPQIELKLKKTLNGELLSNWLG